MFVPGKLAPFDALCCAEAAFSLRRRRPHKEKVGKCRLGAPFGVKNFLQRTRGTKFQIRARVPSK